MSISDKWATTTPGSVSKLNKMTVITGTGAYLAGLTITEHCLLACTSTGSGFTKDHLYLCNADGDATIDLSDINQHDHSSLTAGGPYMDILSENPNVVDSAGRYLLLRDDPIADWNQVLSGTGAVTTDVDGTSGEKSIKLATGATSGSTANIKQYGIEWDCSQNSFFKCMTRFGTASSVAVKFGFAVENLSGADTNTRKYGVELCTTLNNNYFSLSADGTTRSSSDTGEAFSTNRTSFLMRLWADVPQTRLYINEGTVFTKTSNIPSTYASDTGVDSIFRYSLKNNTASDRTLFVYGTRFAYATSSDWN